MESITPQTSYFQRIDYIDIMKGLAIFYVVIGHVLVWTYSDWNSAVKNNFIGTVAWNLIYSFHMPLFMFISGYVVFNPSKNYSFKDICKRVVSYIVPFIFVGFLLYYYRNDPSGIFNYWYLRALTEFVVVLYLVFSLFNLFPLDYRLKCILVIIIFVLIFRIIITVIPEDTFIDNFLCKKHLNLYVYFILGWYIRRNDWLEKILSNVMIFPISLIPIYVYIVFGNYKQTLLIFSGIFATYSIAKLLVDSKLSERLKFWGKYTLEIYILHFFLLFAAPNVGEFFLSLSHLPTALVLEFSYGITISFINVSICLVLAKIISKNDILSFLFFGKLNLINNLR